MMRISKRTTSEKDVIVVVEGRVAGPWVDELKSYCQPFLSNGHKLTLDLTGLSYADRQGLALLNGLLDMKVELSNCSPFLSAQLGAARNEEPGGKLD